MSGLVTVAGIEIKLAIWVQIVAKMVYALLTLTVFEKSWIHFSLCSISSVAWHYCYWRKKASKGIFGQISLADTGRSWKLLQLLSTLTETNHFVRSAHRSKAVILTGCFGLIKGNTDQEKSFCLNLSLFNFFLLNKLRNYTWYVEVIASLT